MGVRTLLVLLLMVSLAVPLAAITWGWKDTDNRYPEVGDILVTWGDQTIGDCTGTLIAPRVVLTAGHCAARFNRYLASGEITDIRVSFDVEPFVAGATAYEVSELVAHPEFRGLQPRSDPYDLGLVILEEDVVGIAPATLPSAPGFLEQLLADGRLGRGTKAAKFTVVGYGASLFFPPPRPHWQDVRQYGYSEFRALLPAWLRMSQQGRTGDQGTCYDDSGAPAFWEEEGERTLVAITSWGDSPCVSSEFNYRVDLPASLAFINEWISRL
jgi:hypothetical protein